MNRGKLYPKELASELKRSYKFVLDMKRGGLKFPTTVEATLDFLQRNPHPTRFRQKSNLNC